MQNYLEAAGTLDRFELERMEEEIGHEIETAFVYAETSPLPNPEDLLKHLYRDKRHALVQNRS
jgi:TPP-dependent pyruvate/acetoin dehydrogenase alpha subunit